MASEAPSSRRAMTELLVACGKCGKMMDRVSLAKHVCNKQVNKQQAATPQRSLGAKAEAAKIAGENDSHGSWDGDFKDEW